MGFYQMYYTSELQKCLNQNLCSFPLSRSQAHMRVTENIRDIAGLISICLSSSSPAL
ncbi:hypothetical protein HanRHA438_Chr12g0546621 [Helianthus annuus]|nr:hypothetical protein HanRHA438_Chr12g0546621 [Helianthus annuus]